MNGWPGSGNPPTFAQQGIIAKANRHMMFDSIAVNNWNDACITYGVSSASEVPSMWRAMRKASDSPGTMSNDQQVIASNAPWIYNPRPVDQTVRWGDYSGTDISWTARCNFWGAHEYYDSGAQDRWRIRIQEYNVCTSDFDLSGEIESNDLIVFADLYAVADEAADVNKDQAVDSADAVLAIDLVSNGLP